MSSITQKVHYNRALGYSLIDLEEVGPGNPSIILSLFPRSAVFSDANNDIQSVITKIKPLAMALRAVTNECKCVVLKVILLKRLVHLLHPMTQLYVFAQPPSREKKADSEPKHTKSFSLGQSSRSMAKSALTSKTHHQMNHSYHRQFLCGLQNQLFLSHGISAEDNQWLDFSVRLPQPSHFPQTRERSGGE